MMSIKSFLRIVEEWDYRHWFLFGSIVQFILVLFFEILFQIFPREELKQTEIINLSTELSFLEYQEPVPSPVVPQTRDLSEEIIETKKPIDKVEEINWQNAVDPSLDFNQRYVPRIAISISPDDYPERAKKSNIGIVKVSVALYIDSSGKIRDVKIRKMESDSGNIELFRNEFIMAVRKVFLEKSKLLNKPYEVDGTPRDFIWYTTVTFVLE